MSERRFILSSLTGGLPQAGHKKSDPTGNHRSQITFWNRTLTNGLLHQRHLEIDTSVFIPP